MHPSMSVAADSSALRPRPLRALTTVMPGVLLLLMMTWGAAASCAGAAWRGTDAMVQLAALCPRKENKGSKQRSRDVPVVHWASALCCAALRPAPPMTRSSDATLQPVQPLVTHAAARELCGRAPVCAATSRCSHRTQP